MAYHKSRQLVLERISLVLISMSTISGALARKAKELAEGMWLRVKRTPDVADYKAAFDAILAEELMPDWRSSTPGASTLKCEFCNAQASFIIKRCAVCYEHRSVPIEHAESMGNR